MRHAQLNLHHIVRIETEMDSSEGTNWRSIFLIDDEGIKFEVVAFCETDIIDLDAENEQTLQAQAAYEN